MPNKANETLKCCLKIQRFISAWVSTALHIVETKVGDSNLHYDTILYLPCTLGIVIHYESDRSSLTMTATVQLLATKQLMFALCKMNCIGGVRQRPISLTARINGLFQQSYVYSIVETRSLK